MRRWLARVNSRLDPITITIIKVVLTILLNLLLITHFFALDLKLELVKEIGDEREDYTFFIVTDAAVSDDGKHVYVVDYKTHSVGIYGLNGMIIKRISQRGQGPGDLNRPVKIDINKKKVFILDLGNRRIIEFDHDLNVQNTFGTKGKYLFSSFHLVRNYFIFHSIYSSFYNKNDILKTPPVVRTDKDFIFVNGYLNGVDKNETFAKKYPVDWRANNEVLIGTDRVNKLFFTYTFPKNPIEFYLYHTNGKLIRKFTYNPEFKYTYMESDFALGMRVPNKYTATSFTKIFIYQKYLIAIIKHYTVENKELKEFNKFILVFDHMGNFLLKKDFDDENTRVLSLSQNGYFVTTKSDQDTDITKIQIYKIVFRE